MILNQDGHLRQLRRKAQDLTGEVQSVYMDDVRTKRADQHRSISVTRQEVIAHAVATQDIRAMTGLDHGDSHPALAR
jgi:hypothetical protein